MTCSFKRQKKFLKIFNAFQNILDDSTRKANKTQVDKSSEFLTVFYKKLVKDNDIEIYSTGNEGKSVVAERFIRTFKKKSYKHMTLAH